VDFDRLVRLLAKSVVRNANRRPRILHVDDDNLVARALGEIADVVTVNSIEAAQRALKAGDFDLAVLDVELAQGRPAPIYCPNCETARAMQFRWSFFPRMVQTWRMTPASKPRWQSRTLQSTSLVATVRDRLASRLASVSGR